MSNGGGPIETVTTKNKVVEKKEQFFANKDILSSRIKLCEAVKTHGTVFIVADNGIMKVEMAYLK